MLASKDDKSKPSLHKIEAPFLDGMARVLDMGDEKYGLADWKKGMLWSKLIDSAERHIAEMKQQQWFDEESGERHASHVATCMMMLQYYGCHAQYSEYDDLEPDIEVDGKGRFPGYEKDLDMLQDRIVRWADSVPGLQDRTPEDALKKLVMEELPELLTSEKSRDPMEWADIFIIMLDIAHLLELDLMSASHAKMAINEVRKWKKDERTGLVNHVEEP